MIAQPQTPPRTLTPEERDAFLLAQAVKEIARLRRLRDEAYVYPELLVVHGFAAAPHLPTVGLMEYLHDDVRQESARQLRKDIAAHGSHERWLDEVNS